MGVHKRNARHGNISYIRNGKAEKNFSVRNRVVIPLLDSEFRRVYPAPVVFFRKIGGITRLNKFAVIIEQIAFRE